MISVQRRSDCAGAALVAHLGDDLAGARQLAEFAGFGHAVRQRLLAVDVLAGLHERLAQGGVPVVGRADQHGVEARRVVEQPAIVFIRLGVLGRLAAGLQGIGPGLVDHFLDPDRTGPPGWRRGRAGPSSRRVPARRSRPARGSACCWRPWSRPRRPTRSAAGRTPPPPEPPLRS